MAGPVVSESADLTLSELNWINFWSIYTMSHNEDGSMQVECTKTSDTVNAFMALQNLTVNDKSFAEYDYLVVEFTGEAGVEYDFYMNVNGTNTHYYVTGTGEMQTLTLEILSNTKLSIYALPDESEGTTTFTIHSMQLQIVE